MNRDTITFDMVCTEHLHWREMSGERQWDVETLDRVYQGFARTMLYFLSQKPAPTPKEMRAIQTLWDCCAVEHEKRQMYRCFLPAPAAQIAEDAESMEGE